MNIPTTTIRAEPRLIKGGLSVDERGIVSYVNDFDFPDVKRFYVIENHRVGYVRAWHGHRREEKSITVIQGTAIIGVIPLATFEKKDTKTFRFVLSARQPAVLYIPGGYANGCMVLEEGTKIVHFSTFTMEEAEGDDMRYAGTLFPGIWEVRPR